MSIEDDLSRIECCRTRSQKEGKILEWILILVKWKRGGVSLHQLYRFVYQIGPVRGVAVGMMNKMIRLVLPMECFTYTLIPNLDISVVQDQDASYQTLLRLHFFRRSGSIVVESSQRAAETM